MPIPTCPSACAPPPGKALATDDAAWRTAFDSVFLGAVRLVRDLAPHIADGGAIALVLAISAKEASPAMPISNGLRPGLAMLVKSFADELGTRGVRINALLPHRSGQACPGEPATARRDGVAQAHRRARGVRPDGGCPPVACRLLCHRRRDPGRWRPIEDALGGDGHGVLDRGGARRFLHVRGRGQSRRATGVAEGYVRWGYPAHWHIVTGLLQLAAGIAIAFPATRLPGMLLAALISAAALATLSWHREWSHTPPSTLLLAILFWLACCR